MNKKFEKKVRVEHTLSKSLVNAICAAYALTCLVFIVYALLLTYTSLSEKSVPLVVLLTTVLSVMMAGFDTARGISEQGWLWGMAAGGIYILLLSLFGSLLTRKLSFGSNFLTLLLISVAGGGVGGIVGINFKK